MNELTCPSCKHTFEVEDFDCGDCPNCNKESYYWDDDWDYELEECGDWIGFYWNEN